MRPPTRIWSTLEDLPGLAAPALEWQQRLGVEFAHIQALLRPTSELATAIDCPSPGGEGCPRRVVDHGNGEIVAVCGDSPRNCDTVKLTRTDIVIHRLDEKALCGMLTKALGLSAPAAIGTGQAGVLHVGDFEPIAGRRFPVHLFIQGDAQSLGDLASRLWAATTTAFILLTPTRQQVALDLAEKLAGWKARVAALSDLLVWNGSAFVATEAATTMLTEFRAAVMPDDGTVNKERFPTPAGASWGDVSIKFVDGHSVSVRCKSESGVFNFTQMGMVDRRNGEPDVQWALLYSLAAGHGQISWRSGSADAKNKKRKQTLNERLTAFFGIRGEATVWDDGAKVYRCCFVLLPEGDDVSAAVAVRQQSGGKSVSAKRSSTR